MFLFKLTIFSEPLKVRPVIKINLVIVPLLTICPFCHPTNSFKSLKDNIVPNWVQHVVTMP